ncbi:MAG: CRISPR-associated endoribonuclease Cas6 [Liquorilactobacillus ghanensis]|uniref:CRISPR-associated endoribonuclease Cas6 n=1 Tax=Liquorilactobacillus ghanensis TaxID=399370 RepID=UPI0039EB1A2A
MKKITIVCKKDNSIIDRKIAVFFNAWIMDHIGEEQASLFHENGEKPYAIHSEVLHNKLNLVVSLLDQKQTSSIEQLLLKIDGEKLHLKSVASSELQVDYVEVTELKEKELTNYFYEVEAPRELRLEFITPTAFKSHGNYIFMPNIRLIFQNLMRKYNWIFENSNHIDVELLDKLCDSIFIKSFKIQSSYYSIHKTYIPGFVGNIKIKCTGVQTLVNFMYVLLKFGEYSGVGIKTGLGMGAIRLEKVERNRNNG